MLILRSISIIIPMLCLVFGMVNSSDAFEITSAPPDSSTYIYGGRTYDTFSVWTSKPHFTVSWYVDGVHAYSSGDGSTTRSVYSPTNTLAGDISGIKYKIEIEAWSADGTIKDTDLFYLTVYEPVTDWRQEPSRVSTLI